jgi:hypothetical protein
MNLLSKEEREKPGFDENKQVFKKIETHVINPKSISVDEFFGYYDLT